jgi:sulfite oxidase
VAGLLPAGRLPAAAGGRPAGGGSWAQAELLDDLGPWAWRHWRIVVDLAPGEHEIVVRAWDSSAATQPEDEAALWNPKGYVNNARPRVRVVAV